MRVRGLLWQSAMVITVTAAAMAGVGAGTASAAPARNQIPSQDFTDTLVNTHSGKCVDVYHSGTANYTNVDLYQCNGSNAQEWLFEPVGTAFGQYTVYQVQSVNDTSECLDVYHSGTTNYTNVDIFQCNGSAAQQWIDYPGSGNTLSLQPVNTVGNLNACLDVYHSGTANYTNIDIFACNGSGAQSFYFG